ncbi:MAG: amidase [Burkholderiaceae bacterium]
MPNANTLASSVEASVLATIEKISAHENQLHSVAQRIDDIARADASRCDALTQAGSHAGSLHGLQFAVKDIIDVAGVPTRSGSLTRSDHPPATTDATVVAKLRAAGAVPVVKTNTVEFALGGWGTNQTVGTPHNPWDMNTPRVPGGSSSGTGVLVGSGLLLAGLGTDTGGSVRIPAAFCGCVGLKTSIGLVSRAGVTPLSETLDTVGPLTQSVATSAAMLAAMQGSDPLDPSTRDVQKVDPISSLNRGNQGLRLGVLPYEAMPDLSGEMRESFELAKRLLLDSGVTLADCSLPMSLAEYQRQGGVISAVEGYSTYGHLVDDPDSAMATPNRERMRLGGTVPASELVKIWRTRQQAITDFEHVIGDFDAIILPSTPATAMPIAEVDESNMSMSSHTRFANYLALAALSVPIGLSKTGLPTSLQIVVRRFADPLALRIGAAFEQVRGRLPLPEFSG